MSGIARTNQETIWIFMNLCYCGRKYAGKRHEGGVNYENLAAALPD